ncbi:MAG: hypothetical protein K9N21_17785 [Deltaproteobacteria bacterium]|nr:hypothetical protein [Deltaproteobacteria bacterium]
MIQSLEYVGVISPLDLLGTSLKREALFFDKIAIPNVLSEFIFRDSLLACPIRSIEYLIDAGIIIDPVKEYIGETTYLKKIGQNLYEKRLKEIEERENALAKELEFPIQSYTAQNLTSLFEILAKAIKETFERIGKQLHYKLGIPFQRVGASIVRFKNQLDYDRRGIAIDLKTGFSLNAFPLYSDNIALNDDFGTGKDDIIRLVIEQLPEPECESVTWERIIDFRNDPETKKLLTYLRHWITEVSKREANYNDILEEIAYYCAKYEEHIRLYKMKLKHGVFETLLMIPAEMIEGVIRLKPTKTVKALFTVKRQNIELLEQEKKAPGRDLAYLIRARDEFDG